MKTENTLRTVRNSLLCFFMALGAGFLVACGGGGGGTSTFPTYLTDAPVEGAEYSGPTSSDVTGKGGVFTASEGVFEFSVGATPLGSVRLNSDWDNSHVTPADFIGVDEAQVITIARILQGLDQNRIHGDGISISQSARDLTVNLLAYTAFTASLNRLDKLSVGFTIAVNSVTLMVPSEDDAGNRLIATRQCLYSGGYAGSYRSNDPDSSAAGEAYFVLEPFANQAMVVERRNGNVSGLAGFTASAVGVRGSVIALTRDDIDNLTNVTLTFVTPRLVNGIWTNPAGTDSGIYRLTRVAGDPTAVGRVVGTEYGDGDPRPTAGLYVLDYFAGDNSGFRGQYYDVATGQSSALDLTIAGGAWPTEVAAATMALTLSGTRGGDNTTVTMGVIRVSDNHGTFEGAASDSDALEGTWCDLVRSTEVAVSGGVLVESLAMSHSRIGGDVSAHRLSRYLDSGIDGVQILG